MGGSRFSVDGYRFYSFEKRSTYNAYSAISAIRFFFQNKRFISEISIFLSELAAAKFCRFISSIFGMDALGLFICN
jgi:hypothetical protein